MCQRARARTNREKSKMRTSGLLLRLNLRMNNAARGTKWKASPLLLLLALIVCVLSQPMRANRSAFATSIAPAAIQQAIACGQTLSGSITASGQQVNYNFNGQANERKTLTLTASGFPTFVTATATVLSPAAVTLATFNANSQQQIMLPETGVYVIQVRASNLVSTGSYSIGLECLLPTSPVDATLACGGLLPSRPINAPAQVDQITFSGQANERKTLTLTAAGFPTFVTATATVYSPTAVVVVTFNANSQQQLTLPENGTYVIQVFASNLVSTGSYSLGLSFCSPPTITLTPNPLTIAAGSSGDMTVTISADQATDTVVTLLSSNSVAAKVDPSVTIPANTASRAFQVMGAAGGSAKITATLPDRLGSGSATASVMVTPQACLPNSALPSGFRPFSQIYYITGPNAGGDRLVVGVMPPAQRQLLNAVPLPGQLNQRFCDPVELA